MMNYYLFSFGKPGLIERDMYILIGCSWRKSFNLFIFVLIREKKTETNPREFQRKKRLSKKKNIDLDFWSRSANQWIHAVPLLWHPAKIKLRVTRHTQHSTLFLAQITNQNHRQLHSTWYNSNSRAKVTAAQPFCLTLAIMCLRTRACSLTRSFISSPGDQKPFGWNYRNSTANNRRGEAKKKSIDK